VTGRILYLQYTDPAGYPPLERSSALLARRGWKVLFLGTRAWGGANLEMAAHPNVEVLRLPFCAGGWRQKAHYLEFCLWAVFRAIFWRPDWIYASDAIACPAALFLEAIGFRRVVYHEHDSPGPRPPTGFFERRILSARKRVAQRARLCLLPNQERARLFEEQTVLPSKAQVIWNCPSKEEVQESKKGLGPGTLRLLYQGTLNPERLPWAVLEALTVLPAGVTLDVVGYETIGHPLYVEMLRQRVIEHGLSGRVRIHPPLSRSQGLWRLALSADVGLALVSGLSWDFNVKNLVGASNKAFEYLAAGLCLLVPDFPEWRKTFVDPGYGAACNPDDPESIRDALRGLLDNPGRMRLMGEEGRKRILSDWNYETQFAPVLKRLEEE